MAPVSGDGRADGEPLPNGITFYGAPWCGDSNRSRALLDRLGVPYAFVDVNQDPAASNWAARQHHGQRRIPTIVFGADGPILIEPSDADLTVALSDWQGS